MPDSEAVPADAIEHITDRGGQLLAIIISHTFQPDKTTFVTSDDLNQQLGFVVYPAGGRIVPHVHTDVKRSTVGTQETLMVRSGRLEVDLYDDEQRKVATRVLEQGDVLTLIAGGHGFQMLEDTVLMEVKQGPYGGEQDKERFEP